MRGVTRELPPPQPRCDSDDSSEYLREMRLVSQTTFESDPAKRRARAQHERLAVENAPFRDVRQSRHAEGSPEGS